MSRAACCASVASVACSEPTCLCANPLRLRMNTSQSWIFCTVMVLSDLFGSLRHCGAAGLLLFGIGDCSLANPRALIVSLAARGDAVAIARSVAGQHFAEFVPVDDTIFPMAGLFVQFEIGIGHRQAEIL